MGNGNSSEQITGDVTEEDGQVQLVSDSYHGGLSSGDQVIMTSDGMKDGTIGGIGNHNLSGDSLANVEAMDTSDLIQVPEETANMMMEDFSDLVGHQDVSNLSTIQNKVTDATILQGSGDGLSSSASINFGTIGGNRTIVMTSSGVSNPVAAISSSISNSGTSTVGQPIVIPVSSSILSSPTALSDFINSIKPPAIPGQTFVKATSVGQTLPGNVSIGTIGNLKSLAPLTKTVSTYSKKQPNIAPAPVNQSINVSSLQSAINTGSIKIVTTPSGQQLLVQQSSPIKQEGGGYKTITIPVSGTSGSSGQQVIFLSSSSPMKQGTGVAALKPGGLKTLAPAPIKVSGANVSIAPGSRLIQSGVGVKQSSVQVVKVVQSNQSGKMGTTTLRPLAPSGTTTKTIQLSSAQIASLMASASGGGKLASGQTIQLGGQQLLIPSTSGTSGGQVIMLPAQLLQGLQSTGGQFTIQTGAASKSSATVVKAPPATPSTRTNYVPIAPSPVTNTSNVHPLTKDVLKITPTHPSNRENAKPLNNYNPGSLMSMVTATDASDASRQRKPCNCTKSGCLKLYCDCFAQGEFCNQCNCVNCYNNLDHEEERQKAVKQCLERNPHAFHPKIGKGKITGDTLERRHTKGCNCRRSGCLKNYCECYEAKILCSDLCKCCGCKNFEDSFERKTLQLMSLAEAADYRSSQANVSKLINWGNDFNTKLPVSIASISERAHLPVNFITPEIIDSTCACLMAVASEGEKRQLSDTEIESQLLAEFGRCLTKIIDWSEKLANLNQNGDSRR